MSHDCLEADSVRILSNLRAAMAPGSTILTQQLIMLNGIANPGLEANIVVLDVATMGMGRKEGTEQAFRDMSDENDFALVKGWNRDGACWCRRSKDQGLVELLRAQSSQPCMNIGPCGMFFCRDRKLEA